MLRRTLLCLPCVLMVTSACAGKPATNPGVGKATPAFVAAAAPQAKQLNLLSGRRLPAADRKRAPRIGAGSYACTPSGFGQRSWCRRN